MQNCTIASMNSRDPILLVNPEAELYRSMTLLVKEFRTRDKWMNGILAVTSSSSIATHLPVFMYLTDYREQTLKDVITQLEPGLFYKVTGLDVKDFELLVSLYVFNSALMNEALYKFKRYEDASLEYIGFDNSMKESSPVGGYDTVVSRKSF